MSLQRAMLAVYESDGSGGATVNLLTAGDI